MAASLFAITATIASGQTVSAAIDLQNSTLVTIFLPAAFTGTTLTFQAAPSVNDGNGNYAAGTYAAVAGVSYTVVQGTVVLVPDFIGARFIKLVSGTSEDAARSIILHAKPIN